MPTDILETRDNNEIRKWNDIHVQRLTYRELVKSRRRLCARRRSSCSHSGFECVFSYPEQFSVFQRVWPSSWVVSPSLPRRSFVADTFYTRELRLASHSVSRSHTAIAVLRYSPRCYTLGVFVTSRISVFVRLRQSTVIAVYMTTTVVTLFRRYFIFIVIFSFFIPSSCYILDVKS